MRQHCFSYFKIELKYFKEDKFNENYILAMQEELNHFESKKVWNLIYRSNNHLVIGTKWVYQNKQEEVGVVIKNKARFVA